MKKTVGVLSLIVILLSQLFSPFVYAVTGEETVIEESVVEVVEEPEVVEKGSSDETKDPENPVEEENIIVNQEQMSGDNLSGTNTEILSGGTIQEETTEENLEGKEDEDVIIENNMIVEAIEKGFGGEVEYNSEEVRGTKEHKNVKVEVYAETGAFEETPTLVIEPLESEKETEIKKVILDYNEDTEELDEEEIEQVAEEKITEVVAFDIKFLDKEEKEVQPREGKVKVEFNYTENETLQETEEHEVKVYHLDDKDNAGDPIEEIKNMKIDEPEVTEGIKVENEELDEQKVEEGTGEQKLTVVGDKFSIYTIVQQVKEEGLINFEFGMISIEDPNNHGQGITVMDRNLGAATTGVGIDVKKTSYGYFYQWGNNYGFSPVNGSIVLTTDTRVNVTGMTGYSSSTFVKVYDSPYTWMSQNNNNLWPSQGQGPCPEGRHVPSIYERRNLKDYYKSTYVNSGVSGFMDYFKISFAGFLDYGNKYTPNNPPVVQSQDEGVLFWSTTPGSSSDKAYYFNVSPSLLIDTWDNQRAMAYQIRCFKNNYEPIDNSYINVKFDFKGGKGSTTIISVKNGESLKQPVAPVRNHSIFSGWYLSGTDSEFVFTGSSIVSPIELYAKWQCEEGYNDHGTKCIKAGNSKEAKLISGSAFNTTIKSLANGTIISHDYDKDTTIKKIKRKSVEPQSLSSLTDISSDDSDYPVYVWFDDGTLYYYSEAGIIYLNEDSSSMFREFKALLSIDISSFDTSNVTDMRLMFAGCTNLSELDLSNFETSNVTNMASMFNGCKSLKSLDLSNFETSIVTSMASMFSDCQTLSDLNISNFNTINVTDMSNMFNRCKSLQTIDVSGFNTSNVTNMSNMFSYCNNLSSLNLSSFNTSNVTTMENMFGGCKSLQTIDVSNFNTSNVTNMRAMFSSCTNLSELDLSNFNTSNVTNMASMFNSSKSLVSLDLSSFNTSSVTDMSYMFSYCNNLSSLNLSGFNTSNVTNMSNMFSQCNNLSSLDLSGFNTSNLTNMSNMFSYCNNLSSLNLSSFNTSNVTDMSYMFYDCDSLTTLDLSSFRNSNVTTLDSMFNSCDNIESIYLPNLDTSKVTTMSQMFASCPKLKIVDISNFNTKLGNLYSTYYMFGSDYALKTIYAGENFLTDTVSSSSYMFTYSSYYNTQLMGGNGTVIVSSPTDKTYAKVDKKGQQGYFTDPSHFAIRFKDPNGVEITTQWISTGGTAQALTGRLTYYKYYTGDDLEHNFDLTTPLYVYTEIYATGLNAYEVKFYSGYEVIYTGYVSGDNQSKIVLMPENPLKVGYDFAGWTKESTTTLFDTDEIITSDLELHANWENPNQEHIGTTGCYDYRSYYEGGEYLAEITNYRRDNTSCLGNNLILPDVIKRNGRDYKVVSLGADSFKQKGISGLLTLSQYLKSIGNMAFIGNSDLTGIVFNENLESIGTQSFQLCGIKSLSFPASLRSIGDISFTANTSLTSLSFAESTNTLTIGNVAFNGCSLEDVTIPSNVTSIGQQAFEDNPLKTVRVLSENVTIGGSAFKAKNNSIEALVLSGGGDLTYSMFGTDGETIFNNLTSLELGNGVTKIGNDLFKKTKLISVRIPGSVTLLDSNSFASNDLLEEIVIEEGLKTINPGVFNNNKKLKSLIIPNSVTDVSGYTITNNPELENVVFGNGVERLQSVLNNCPKLSHLDLGNVKEIYSTISGTQLQSLTIPASMVIIGKNTFEHNPNLTTLVFEGNSLTTLGTGAFNDTSITNVILPNSLTTLGNGSFCSDFSSNPGSIVGVVSGATAAQIESLEAQDNTECLVLKKDKYTLTYNAGAHSGLVDNQQTLGVVVDYNGTIQLTGNGAKTAISQKGYIFLGWTTELNGITPLAVNTYTITGDVTLYPVFKKDSITKKIKFYKNGNEGYTYNGNDYTEDQEFILCTIQERYNADEDITTCSENIEFPMGISETTPVTRGWTRNIGGDGMLYTGGEEKEITSEDTIIDFYLQMYAPEKVFKANYEYGSGVEELTITSGSCMIDETINGNVQSGSCEVVLPELDVLTGYHTPLWYKKGEDVTYPNLVIVLTGDEILEAKAIPNNYTIVYKPGTGTGEMESQEIEYDKEENLNKNKYTKNGYHFSGWIDTLGKEYRDGEKVLNLLTEGMLELTAQWALIPPAAGGGKSIIPATKEQEHNAAEKKPEEKQESNQDKQQDEQSKTPENTNTSNQTNTQQSSSTSSDNSYKTVVDPEILSAYEWAYKHDVTTIPTIDEAMPDGVVKRGHLAKMVVNYATNILGREIPEKIPSECRWNDNRKDWESEEIKDYAVKSCALGLMGLDMPKFLPNLDVTRAQFGTIMSRLLWGKKYAGGTPYYRKHLNALKENNIMTQLENPERRVELRQWVWVMLMRSAENK